MSSFRTPPAFSEGSFSPLGSDDEYDIIETPSTSDVHDEASGISDSNSILSSEDDFDDQSVSHENDTDSATGTDHELSHTLAISSHDETFRLNRASGQLDYGADSECESENYTLDSEEELDHDDHILPSNVSTMCNSYATETDRNENSTTDTLNNPQSSTHYVPCRQPGASVASSSLSAAGQHQRNMAMFQAQNADYDDDLKAFIHTRNNNATLTDEEKGVDFRLGMRNFEGLFNSDKPVAFPIHSTTLSNVAPNWPHIKADLDKKPLFIVFTADPQLNSAGPTPHEIYQSLCTSFQKCFGSCVIGYAVRPVIPCDDIEDIDDLSYVELQNKVLKYAEEHDDLINPSSIKDASNYGYSLDTFDPQHSGVVGNVYCENYNNHLVNILNDSIVLGIHVFNPLLPKSKIDRFRESSMAYFQQLDCPVLPLSYTTIEKDIKFKSNNFNNLSIDSMYGTYGIPLKKLKVSYFHIPSTRYVPYTLAEFFNKDDPYYYTAEDYKTFKYSDPSDLHSDFSTTGRLNASYAILQCLQLNVDHWKASWDITTLATSDVIEHMMMRRRCYSQFQSNKEKKPSRFFGRNYPLVGENTWTFAPCKNHSNYRVENVSSSCWNFFEFYGLAIPYCFYSILVYFRSFLSNNFLSSYFPERDHPGPKVISNKLATSTYAINFTRKSVTALLGFLFASRMLFSPVTRSGVVTLLNPSHILESGGFPEAAQLGTFEFTWEQRSFLPKVFGDQWIYLANVQQPLKEENWFVLEHKGQNSFEPLHLEIFPQERHGIVTVNVVAKRGFYETGPNALPQFVERESFELFEVSAMFGAKKDFCYVNNPYEPVPSVTLGLRLQSLLNTFLQEYVRSFYTVGLGKINGRGVAGLKEHCFFRYDSKTDKKKSVLQHITNRDNKKIAQIREQPQIPIVIEKKADRSNLPEPDNVIKEKKEPVHKKDTETHVSDGATPRSFASTTKSLHDRAGKILSVAQRSAKSKLQSAVAVSKFNEWRIDTGSNLLSNTFDAVAQVVKNVWGFVAECYETMLKDAQSVLEAWDEQLQDAYRYMKTNTDEAVQSAKYLSNKTEGHRQFIQTRLHNAVTDLWESINSVKERGEVGRKIISEYVAKARNSMRKNKKKDRCWSKSCGKGKKKGFGIF